MITITLTEREAKLIREDISTSFEYFDSCADPNDGLIDEAEREEAVNDAMACESILKKLGDQ